MAIEKTYRFRLEIANEQQFKQALERAMPTVRQAFTGADAGGAGGGAGFGDTIAAMSMVNKELGATFRGAAAEFRNALQGVAPDKAKHLLTAAEVPMFHRMVTSWVEAAEGMDDPGAAHIREVYGKSRARELLTSIEKRVIHTLSAIRGAAVDIGDADLKQRYGGPEGASAIPQKEVAAVDTGVEAEKGKDRVEDFASMAAVRMVLSNTAMLGKALGDLADITGDVKMGIRGRMLEAAGGVAGATAVGAYVGSMGGPIGTVIGSLLAGGASALTTRLGLRGEEEKLRLTQAAEDYATEGTLSAIAREGKVLALTLRRASATHEEELHAIDREIAAANETTRGRRDMARAIADATRATERMTRGQRASAQLWVDTAGVHLSDEMAAYSRTMALSRRYGARGKVDPDAMAEKLLQANEARYQAMLGQLIDERNLSGMLQNEFQVRKAAIEAVRENTARQIKQQAEDDRHANALYRANEELTTTAVRATAMQKLVIEYQRRNLHGMDDDLNLSRMSAEVWKMLRDEGQRLIEGQPRGRLGIESLWEEATRARNELSFSDMQKAVDRLIPVLMKNSDDGTQIMQRLLDAVNDIRRERGNTYDP